MSRKPREKLNKNLVIAADDGYLYEIPVEVYTHEKYRLPSRSAEYKKIQALVDVGVVSAAIPEPPATPPPAKATVAVADLPESRANAAREGALLSTNCYLINLAALRYFTIFDEDDK